MFRVIAASLIVSAVQLLFLVASAKAETGVVALRVSGCDYYLIETNQGYTVVEWYGGHDPSRGEPVIGSFNSYGMKTIFFGQGREEGRVWIDDYWLSEDDALEKISDQCN
jgi:hypothetical protein